MSEFPPGWTSATGADVFEFVTSGSRGWAQYYSDEGATFVRIGNLDHGTTALDLRDIQHVRPPSGAEGERTRLRPNDVLVSITAELGMIGLVPETLGEAYINQHIALARPRPPSEPRFLAWYLASEADGKRQLQELRRGATKAGLGLDDIRSVEFPLAPLPEQKRIADKLDALLARVNACRDRLDRVPSILKRFRQSVLAAATSGELTREWREERGLKRSEWMRTTFDEICSEITVGFVGKMSNQYRQSGIPFLRSQNVRPFKFDPRELRYISPEFHRSISKSTLRPGDVAVVRTGAPGQCCVIPSELPEANCSDLVIVRPGAKLDSTFAVVFINSDTSQSFVRAEQVGVAQTHFNVGSMKRAPVDLPSLAEQVEIARRVEKLFGLADEMEMRMSCAQQITDRLAPSLLSKAFRGELVPQDLADEPASALLASLRSAQTNAAAEPSRKRPKAPGKRPTMSNVDKDSIKAAILKLKTDRFSFDELRAQASGDYESLRATLFELLEDPNPIVRQVFDKKAKTMRLERVKS